MELENSAQLKGQVEHFTYIQIFCLLLQNKKMIPARQRRWERIKYAYVEMGWCRLDKRMWTMDGGGEHTFERKFFGGFGEWANNFASYWWVLWNFGNFMNDELQVFLSSFIFCLVTTLNKGLPIFNLNEYFGLSLNKEYRVMITIWNMNIHIAEIAHVYPLSHVHRRRSCKHRNSHFYFFCVDLFH